eukprot:TRINITY_DN5665_c0_g2_i1.p1 TRINITY_DN5665_c0_g2~~TRINITY_DN5665_c0_g2_i1.p1  ORF type:complete len:575 (-),score=109.26 TRINITY_DN5665_c0_g2_i1:33-1757(-)
MGGGLPKPVTSVAVKRHSGTAFRVGMAEMNGFRASMEDAHVIHAEDSWGFFGVFDGHGGDQCSKFIARRIQEQLASGGLPADDAAVKDMALKLDQEFLDTGQPSGSTGTFVIIKPPSKAGGKYSLRVGNIGDSRVLLGDAYGTIHPGPGTDSGLTTDHKPDYPSERARIERTGGKVESVMGVARVNGDLAVSRAFGDSQHKKTGGPSLCDHPVTADPELQEFECGPTDFLMLVCDGISEGSFPNAEVVKFAAEHLKPSANGDVDPAKAAMAVCHEAIRQSSKDNLSCMIVLLGGGEVPGEREELIPGPFADNAHESPAFRKAYAAMAEHAGMKLADAVERRLSIVQSCIEKLEKDSQDPCDELGGEKPDLGELQHELSIYLKGCAENGDVAGWISKLEACPSSDRDHELEKILGHVQENEENKRRVIVAPRDELQPAVEQHQALKWDDRLANTCGKVGRVETEDPSDGTIKVKFAQPVGFTAWLPNSVLQDSTRIKVVPLEELRGAVEAHPDLSWDEDRMAKLAGRDCDLLREDKAAGTVLIQDSMAGYMEAWLPKATTTHVNADNATEGASAV